MIVFAVLVVIGLMVADVPWQLWAFGWALVAWALIGKLREEGAV